MDLTLSGAPPAPPPLPDYKAQRDALAAVDTFRIVTLPPEAPNRKARRDAMRRARNAQPKAPREPHA